MREKSCPNCGGSDIVENIAIESSSGGDCGLCYKSGMLAADLETLLADLCKSCGSIARIHVRNADRKWFTRHK